MKRSEEIHSAAQARANQYSNPAEWSDCYHHFSQGAEWADSHIDTELVYTKKDLRDMGFAFTINGDIVPPKEENEHLKKYIQHILEKQRKEFLDKIHSWIKVSFSTQEYRDCLIRGLNEYLFNHETENTKETK